MCERECECVSTSHLGLLHDLVALLALRHVALLLLMRRAAVVAVVRGSLEHARKQAAVLPVLTRRRACGGFRLDAWAGLALRREGVKGLGLVLLVLLDLNHREVDILVLEGLARVGLGLCGACTAHGPFFFV